MYVSTGNQVEKMVINELSRIYPNSRLNHNKTRGSDIEFCLKSRKINIEVKSCKLLVKDKTTKYRLGRFIIYSNTLDDYDVFVFHVRNTSFYRIYPTSYLKHVFQEKIERNKNKRLFSLSIHQIFHLKFFTLEYILKNYCNQKSCSLDCFYCPYFKEKQTKYWNILWS